MAVKNSTILDRVWLENTWEYQQRVPQASQQGVAAVAEFLFDPLNKMYYNQFVDSLINRIGMTRINSKMWANPWSTFKKGNLPFGSSVQDMGVKWLKAHTYEDDLDSLLEIKRPEIEPAYYTLNRRDQYTISVNYDELRNAFVDEYGLNRLINTITDVPISSDNYDEYQSMKALIAEYETRHGFYKEQITAITNEATAKDFLVKARAYAGKLKFPSVYYNIIDIPAFAEEQELVLLIDPTSLAYIDVDALSAAFNIDRADIKYRIELVDEWPIPGAVALLTTEDFFQVYDVLYTTTSFYNPQNLTTNYYLTHWEILAFSPFVPAILFTTETGTSIGTVTYNQNVTVGLRLLDSDNNVITPDSPSSARVSLEEFTKGVYVDYYAQDETQLNGLTLVDGLLFRGIMPTSVFFRIGTSETVTPYNNIDIDGLIYFDYATSKLLVNIDSYLDNIAGMSPFINNVCHIDEIQTTLTFNPVYRNPSGETTMGPSQQISVRITDINRTINNG